MNPSIANEQKLKVLDAIAGRIGMFPQVRNFIAVVMEHDRLAELNEMVAEFARGIGRAGAGWPRRRLRARML